MCLVSRQPDGQTIRFKMEYLVVTLGKVWGALLQYEQLRI